MAAITEDYVSFETAKLLKDKHFNEQYHMYYVEDGKYRCDDLHDIKDYAKSIVEFDYLHRTKVPAPTLQMAMKWLREEFDLITYVKLVNDGDPCHDAWGFSIYNKFTNESIKGHRLWFKYEEACETAIKYCLENLI